MSAFSDFIGDGLTELETGLGATLTAPSGTAYPCVPKFERVGFEIAVGRSIERIELTVYIRKSHFVTADTTMITADSEVILADNENGTPRPGTATYRTGNFRNKSYRVLQVSEDPSRAYFMIDLGSTKR